MTPSASTKPAVYRPLQDETTIETASMQLKCPQKQRHTCAPTAEPHGFGYLFGPTACSGNLAHLPQEKTGLPSQKFAHAEVPRWIGATPRLPSRGDTSPVVSAQALAEHHFPNCRSGEISSRYTFCTLQIRDSRTLYRTKPSPRYRHGEGLRSLSVSVSSRNVRHCHLRPK